MRRIRCADIGLRASVSLPPLPPHATEADLRAILPSPGGGIIGCTTAYYLTRHPKFNPDLHKITLLEASSIAAGASGKAGGLLALWAYPECLVPLSYRLHGELAREHGGAERWGYRRVGCGSLHAVVTEQALRAQDLRQSQAAVPNGSVPNAALSAPSTEQEGHDRQWEKLPKQDEKAAGLLRDSRLPADLDWIQGNLVDHYAEMGSPGATETSQVHPYLFTTSIAELAREGGVEIRLKARVTKINHSRTAVTSVEYEDGETGNSRILDDLTDVIVTAGPWTGRILPKTKIEGLRVHSVVYDVDLSPYAVFTEIELPNEYSPEHRARKGQRRKHRGNVDPEVYARPGNEAYACGKSSLCPGPGPGPLKNLQTRGGPADRVLLNRNRRRTGHRSTAPRDGRRRRVRHGPVRRPDRVHGHREPRAERRPGQDQAGLLHTPPRPVRRRAQPPSRPDRRAGPVGGQRPYVLGHPERPRHRLPDGRVSLRRRRDERRRRET